MLSNQSQATDREVLAGLVERVTFHHAENGFCVLRVKARGHRELITVVGHAATITAGEWITASGEWANDRTHGQQFKAHFLRCSAPTSADGIEKYLASPRDARTSQMRTKATSALSPSQATHVFRSLLRRSAQRVGL